MSSVAPSEIRCSRRAAASLRTSERMSFAAAAAIFLTPGSSSLHMALMLVSAPTQRRMSERWLRTLFAAIENSSTRTSSGSAVSSISFHNFGRSSSRSATRKTAITCASEAPSSSVRSRAALGPRRLTRRFATRVARISWRSRWARIASACGLRIGLGNASYSSRSTILSSASLRSSAAS